jgi:putative heme-binding domain-containing protein
MRPLTICLLLTAPLLLRAAPPAPPANPNADVSVAANPQVEEIIRTFGGRGQLKDDSAPTPAAEALKRFELRKGYRIELVASEPEITQPLFCTFDSRGRLWVVQYRQYQFPAGLKVVRYDQHLRAVFDKVPAPPPHGTPGADKITVLEDSDGDGTYDRQKDVITGLNIATAVQPGPGGIWVLNPPYLLFYPDANGDDVPDATPEVHLSGFGLEDTHSVASNLTWGPDGWLYGANGSTTTGDVSSAVSSHVKWQGQCIWRYHPGTKVFEVYAEGGGNTFSLAIDSTGRVFSGTNGGKTRGMYYPQGAYGTKNWGKHGPLTNPYAFGFIEHMKHEGDERRFPQAFCIYEAPAIPELQGKIIAANALHNIVWVSQLLPDGSTFRTIDEEPLLRTSDKWFRPVWIGTGPDGFIYLADWYDSRLSHVRPVDDWHKGSGRIYRIRPAGDVKPSPWKAPADTPVQVRAKEAALAKRAPLDKAMPILAELIRHDEDVADPHLPLLIWWALEAHADSGWSQVESWFSEPAFWSLPMVREHLAQRIARRYAAAGGTVNFERCARLLDLAPDDGSRQRLLTGLNQAFQGRPLPALPAKLQEALTKNQGSSGNASALLLSLRQGDAKAKDAALKLAVDPKTDLGERAAIIETLAETGEPRLLPILLNLIRDREPAIQRVALRQLPRFDDPKIARTILDGYQSSISAENDVRATANRVLAMRPAWALSLLQEIDRWFVRSEEIGADVVQQLRQYADPAIQRLVEKHFGKAGGVSSPEKLAEVSRVRGAIQAHPGDAARGQTLFAARCAVCHRLFDAGGAIGPELTGYERGNLDFWLPAIIDPSLEIREEYQSYVAQMKDGRQIVGMMAEQSPDTVTLRDIANQRSVLDRSGITTLQALPASLMPEGLLGGLSDAELADLFAYLRK